MAMPEHEPLSEEEIRDDLLSRVIDIVSHPEEQESASLAFISDYSDADLANLLESITDQYRAVVCRYIPADRGWGILHLLHYETARHVLDILTEAQMQELLKRITEIDVLTFAEILPSEVVEDYLEQQESLTIEQMQQALSYQDEEVGRYLNNDILRSRPTAPVRRVLERIEKYPERDFVGVYAVDAQGEYQGACTIEQLRHVAPSTPLANIIVEVDPINDDQDITKAAQHLNPVTGFAWHPVQKEGKIIGAIAVSILMQRLKERSLEVLASETAQDEEDLFTPVTVAARMRAIWLTTNLLTAFLASWVIGLFGDALQQVVALAILMPVVASMGGIAGSQTLAVALRGIALNHLKRSNLKLLLDKELKIAAFNGVLLGALIGVVVSFWFNSVPLGGIIFVAIVFNSLAAASSGTVIPFVLKQMKIDPAVAGSVILTTVTDVVGFFIFLGLGSLLLLP
ncbi:magnesium transporter [Shewanella algidipiscicola]|uniref:Magnesium transporter n=1 Tax=Shewanella algidipiscicola TaxID=614070 RepID=A0ABQ4P3F4_9GAMM|nr:magnesium transporter [Shewanella algidipiscicola]GIU41696.1 magnesium transporter [Shewanella algidipiscicola]